MNTDQRIPLPITPPPDPQDAPAPDPTAAPATPAATPTPDILPPHRQMGQ